MAKVAKKTRISLLSLEFIIFLNSALQNKLSCHCCHHLWVFNLLIYNELYANVKMTANKNKSKFVIILVEHYN